MCIIWHPLGGLFAQSFGEHLTLLRGAFGSVQTACLGSLLHPVFMSCLTAAVVTVMQEDLIIHMYYVCAILTD